MRSCAELRGRARYVRRRTVKRRNAYIHVVADCATVRGGEDERLRLYSGVMLAETFARGANEGTSPRVPILERARQAEIVRARSNRAAGLRKCKSIEATSIN